MRDPESAAAVRQLEQALQAIRGDVRIDAVAFADPAASGTGLPGSQQAVAEKEAAENLIERELQTMEAKDYMAALGPEPTFAFMSPGTALGDEMARVEARLPPPALRGAVPGPPGPGVAPAVASEAWRLACEPLEARAEELSGQALAIAAMERYGAEAWAAHAAELQQQTRSMGMRAAELSEASDAVNALRKEAGRTLANKLVRMRRRREEAAETAAALEIACAVLQSKRGKQEPGLSQDESAEPAVAAGNGGEKIHDDDDDDDEPME
jgi:hypothetical protein